MGTCIASNPSGSWGTASRGATAPVGRRTARAHRDEERDDPPIRPTTDIHHDTGAGTDRAAAARPLVRRACLAAPDRLPGQLLPPPQSEGARRREADPVVADRSSS